MLETEQVEPELAEYSDYYESVAQPGFASRLQMFAVIVYLISQGFTIPILPIGPSWAVWPRLDDFTVIFLLATAYFSRSNISPMNPRERRITYMIMLGLVAAACSVGFGTIMRPEVVKGPSFGLFQTVRVLEYFSVWICVRGMAFTTRQFNILSYTIFVMAAFVVVIGACNASGILPPSRMFAHLPYIGPWGAIRYTHTGAMRPIGPFGWNSGHMVDYLTFITAFLLASKKPSVVLRLGLMGLIAGIIFLTGSRAATIGWLIMVVLFSYRRVKRLVFVLLAMLLFFALISSAGGLFDIAVVERATEKLSSITQRAMDPTLSGRTVQWAAALDFIASNPSTFLWGVGWGFGGMVLPTAIGNAHCMYLQVLLELGIVGLIMFLVLLFNMYRLLQGKDSLLTALRAAFIGLLAASLTGEVFYPVVAMGSFLGFVAIMFGIGSAVNRGRDLENIYIEYTEDYDYYFDENDRHFNLG